ncbi:sigma-70 family RNA polymerase sigma factor [Bacillus sp. Bva_UNVM-123]|uniref:sigma-70 family RNA polymerase sigma factor n=1 Tax=Bacillus sp. Bva_UNVM-123 TaxID=2829798 RepID=UPI00391F4335
MEPYKARNNEEFDEIVREYVNDIRKIIYTYVKNHHTMEDITQEVFLSAYRNLGQFRGDSAIKTWLIKIAINKAKDYLKSWNYRAIKVTNLIKEDSVSRKTEQVIIDNDWDQELARVIMDLPIKYREVIILYYYEELDTNEISNILNINLNTVKTRLNRSRDLVKRRLDFIGEISKADKKGT